MPAYVIRIMLFMATITLLSFVYELHYSSEAIEITGEIISINSKAKGRDITISFINHNQAKEVLTFGVGPITDIIEQYSVGDKIPLLYCRECHPAVKIGDTPNAYSLTFMMLLFSCVITLILTITWWKGRGT